MLKVIFSFIDFIKVKFLINTLWKISPKNYLKSIGIFSATESDTVWQLAYGMQNVESAEHRAEILRQLIEEQFHSEQFSKILYNSNFSEQFKLPPLEKKPLYHHSEPIWKLLTYCYIGESEATERFQHILKSSKNAELNAALKKIIHDETGHVGQAYSILKAMGATESQINREIFFIKVRRRYESLVRLFKRLFEYIVDALLFFIYFIFGILVYKTARRKLQEHHQ